MYMLHQHSTKALQIRELVEQLKLVIDLYRHSKDYQKFMFIVKLHPNFFVRPGIRNKNAELIHKLYNLNKSQNFYICVEGGLNLNSILNYCDVLISPTSTSVLDASKYYPGVHTLVFETSMAHVSIA